MIKRAKTLYIQELTNLVTNTLKEDKKVAISGLGTFKIKKGRKGGSAKYPDRPVKYAERVVFVPCEEIKKIINNVL